MLTVGAQVFNTALLFFLFYTYSTVVIVPFFTEIKKNRNKTIKNVYKSYDIFNYFRTLNKVLSKIC